MPWLIQWYDISLLVLHYTQLVYSFFLHQHWQNKNVNTSYSASVGIKLMNVILAMSLTRPRTSTYLLAITHNATDSYMHRKGQC